jgi:L-amino acid ligase C-terminal domain 2
VHTAAMCLLSPGGTIESIRVPPEVADNPAMYYITITAGPGDVILRPPDGSQTIGGLGALGPSFDEAMRTATDLAGRIEARMRRSS